jgi:two-component system alkaline phosphatase synthesis response regulator PhoP
MDNEADSGTILIVDDAPQNLRTLMQVLTLRNYKVRAANSGFQALESARHQPPSLILLDVMMPEMDGYEFIPLYRREADTPIILLTAKLEETDKVLGLELGADDYITKPFGMRELLARIRAVLRRTGKDLTASRVLQAGDITLDQDSRTVKIIDRFVNLTPSEFDLLAVLMSAPGRAFTRQDLLNQLDGSAWVERTVDVHVRNLRAKIEPEPANPRYVETVFGIGYRFSPDAPHAGR